MLKWNTHFRLLIPEVLLKKYQLRICCILCIISPSRNTYSLFLMSRYHLPFTPSCHSVQGGCLALGPDGVCVSGSGGVHPLDTHNPPWQPPHILLECFLVCILFLSLLFHVPTSNTFSSVFLTEEYLWGHWRHWQIRRLVTDMMRHLQTICFPRHIKSCRWVCFCPAVVDLSLFVDN